MAHCLESDETLSGLPWVGHHTGALWWMARILSAKEASQHEPSQVDVMDEHLAKNTRCPYGLVSDV